MTMNKRIAICVIALVAGVLLASSPAARADELNLKTTFTIDQPVRIPGNVVLPPGTYVMKRVHPEREPHLVRITDATETKVYATVFGIPRELRTPSETPKLIFGESPAGTSQPLTAWFYPGRVTGLEFPETISKNEFNSSNE